MPSPETFTLSEVARHLDVPQHRLIHLCEKGVVVPDVHGASGRGSSRVFSVRNVLELAVALKLRDMMLPVSAVGSIVHVLRSFEQTLRGQLGAFSLTDDLRSDEAPDLRVIVSDGRLLYFSLGARGAAPKLFGGIELEQLTSSGATWDGAVRAVRTDGSKARDGAGFGGLEHSRFGRLELSITAIARTLPLD